MIPTQGHIPYRFVDTNKVVALKVCMPDLCLEQKLVELIARARQTLLLLAPV
jgi:hypothetical protein